MKETLSYDDVLLEPQYSDISSRSEIDISVDMGAHLKLEIPIISSPMDTVTEGSMAMEMNKLGGLGILHRYNSIERQAEMVKEVKRKNGTLAVVGAAVGVTGDYLERATALLDAGCRVLCVDVAHGHHENVRKALQVLRGSFGEHVHIMAGNVASVRGIIDLHQWGADSIRVGIGGGSICSTRIVTGHGVPTFQSVLECAKTSYDTKIIADGGIKTTGDMVKALAAGADFVMLGSLLAGTDEAPGDVTTNVSGEKYKYFRGMASRKAQVEWRGWSSTPEGVSTMIPYKGPVGDILADLRGGIASGVSYSGAFGLKDLRRNVEFIKQTSAGMSESRAHILGGG